MTPTEEQSQSDLDQNCRRQPVWLAHNPCIAPIDSIGAAGGPESQAVAGAISSMVLARAKSRSVTPPSLWVESEMPTML